VRERAAAVNVSDEVDVGPNLEGDCHVDDVGRAQVDLGRTASALDDDLVEFSDEALERGFDDRPQAVAALEPGQRGRDRVVSAHDDHLAVRLSLRLQEHGVHAHVGRNAGRECLNVLRAPDLKSVGGHGGVRAHVLGLERRDPKTGSGEVAAQRGGQKRLARVARAAHDHDRTLRHVYLG
jgi:hypothetical protein